jgi:ATP-binding cassette, subfamily B, bacterial
MKLDRALWPPSELPHLLDAVARLARLDRRAAYLPVPPSSPEQVAAWMESAGAALGLEVESLEMWGHEAEGILRSASPALVPTSRGWVGILEVKRDSAVLAAPGLTAVRVPFAELVWALSESHVPPFESEVDELLGHCGIAPGRRERARQSLLRERLRSVPIGVIWRLRTPPGAGFARQLADDGVTRRCALLVGAHAAEYLLLLASWYLLGRETLQGRLDPGWLTAWALSLAALVPFHLWTTWLQGSISIRAGGLLRQRLLEGILRMAPDEIRQDGAGRFLSSAIDAGLVESLALSGGILSLLAILELGFSTAVLAAGAGGLRQAAALGLCLAATLFLAWRYFRRRSKWTVVRLNMTHGLVERMSGHRTRLAQENPVRRHDSEDREALEYLELGAAMDSSLAWLTGLMPRAWLWLGIAVLAPAFAGSPPTQAALAISLGGILLGWQALHRLTAGLADLAGAVIAWRQVSPLFHAAEAVGDEGCAVGSVGGGEVVLQARDLSFHYEGRGQRVLDGVDIEIRRGDWALLEGPSGGGKSTLVSVLAGLRDASGLVLVNGMDRRTMGSREWRRRIAAAPQYHENHVLSGAFAFNLLMGRKWPCGPAELKEAEQICRELGLGSLLDRMPGGMMQIVGETGWQLSQGERSRLFIARALLQDPELLLLDESFAALDPENLRQSLECVLRRAKTLLVVAHP